MAKITNPIKTIVIDNFTGALTREINGPLNSGMANYDNSFGYNPIVKPKNLTWLLQPTKFDPATQYTGALVLAGGTRLESGTQYVYTVDINGVIYKFNVSLSTSSSVATLSTGTPTFNFGASMAFYNGKIWISNDKGLSYINFDGSGETQVGTWDSSHFIQNTYHPLQEFQGKLYVGNTTDGTTTNIGEIDTTNLITTYARLSPALPVGTYIRDMDLKNDFSYLMITASGIPSPTFAPSTGNIDVAAGDSFKFFWNGSDQGITAGLTLPAFGVTALNNFGDSQYMFMYDFFGSSIYDGAQKVIASVNSLSPQPNATASTGNFIMWAAPTQAAGSNLLNMGITMHGKFDASNFPSLYRIFLKASAAAHNPNYTAMPFMRLISNYGVNLSGTYVAAPLPNILYFSARILDNRAMFTDEFYSLTINPNPNYTTELTQPILGTYQTQTELFPKKIAFNEARVYCEPTVAGNSFTLNLIGANGQVITNGSITYTYVAGSDVTLAQGSLDRIRLDLDTVPTLALGVQIVNTGTTNMTIKKVEIDVTPAGQ